MEVVEIGERLKKLREDRNLSQGQLASMMGISTSSISAYERGVNNLSRDSIEHYCSIFHVTPGYVLGLEKYERTSISLTVKSGYDTPKFMSFLQKTANDVVDIFGEALKDSE